MQETPFHSIENVTGETVRSLSITVAFETNSLRQASTQEIAKSAIDYLLTRLDVKIPAYERHPELERRVAEITQFYSDVQVPQQAIITGISIAITAYNHIEDFDTKLFNSLPVTIGLRLSHLLDNDFSGTRPKGSNVFEVVLPLNLIPQ